jgi:UDP-glucose 4-epimerase
MKNKLKILITGGGGFIGSHLAEAELKRGNKVIALDLASNGKVKHLLNNPDFKYIQGDMLDESVVEPLVKKVDLIYHFGAIADPVLYCDNPLKVLEVDLEGTQKLIKLAYKYNKKFIFASTSEIYGKNLNVPWKENYDRVLGSTTKFRWSYSTSKAAGEHYCFAYAQKGLKIAITRFFNFYGPRLDFLDKGRVMTCFLGQFLKNKPITVVEPGDQTRCFTYIDDGIKGILKVAHLPQAEGDVFNLGTTEEISIIDLAKLMKKIGRFKSKIKLISCEKKYGESYDDIYRRVPDISKAKKILKWEPKISLEEGLKRTIEYYKKEFKNEN